MQGINRPRFQPKRPPVNVKDAISFAHIMQGLGCLIAFVLSVISFVTIMHHLDNPPPAMDIAPGRLSLYDNTIQRMTGNNNSWVPVIFNKQALLSSGTWLHLPGSSNIECLRKGAYIVHFSLQSNLSPLPEASFPCKPCHVWLEAQCVLQGLSIPSSVAFTSPATGTRTTSNTFVVEANTGDILQIQFKSHCPHIILTNITQKRLTHFNDPLPSASILIY